MYSPDLFCKKLNSLDVYSTLAVRPALLAENTFDLLTGNISTLNNEVYIRNYPSESPALSSSNTVTSSTTKTDLRARGRATILKYKHVDQDSSFRLFGIRMDVYPDGRR